MVEPDQNPNTEKPNHICNVCGEVFSNTDKLDTHTVKTHGTKQDM